MSIKQKAQSLFSTNISSFCNMVEQARRDYEWNCEEVNRLDRLTQDYLHMLELNGLNYKERAKVATQLAYCRQLRRKSKDIVEVLEPLIMFLNTDKGKTMINHLRETLGKTRKIEERMLNRTYRYKVYESGEEE